MRSIRFVVRDLWRSREVQRRVGLAPGTENLPVPADEDIAGIGGYTVGCRDLGILADAPAA